MLELAFIKPTSQVADPAQTRSKLPSAQKDARDGDAEFESEYAAAKDTDAADPDSATAKSGDDAKSSVDPEDGQTNTERKETPEPAADASAEVVGGGDKNTDPRRATVEPQADPDFAVAAAARTDVEKPSLQPVSSSGAALSERAVRVSQSESDGARPTDTAHKDALAKTQSLQSTVETVVSGKAVANSSAPEEETAGRNQVSPDAIRGNQTQMTQAVANEPTAQAEQKTEPTRWAPAEPQSRESNRKDRSVAEISVSRDPQPATPSAPAEKTAPMVAAPKLQQKVLTAHPSSSETLDVVKFAVVEGEGTAQIDNRNSNATQASATGQAIARTETPGLIARQMAEALQRMPDRPVEIALSPKELGRVRMSISAAEAGITVSVLAERPETLDLMRRNIDQLSQEFEAIGYSDINFAFSEGDPQQSFDDQQNEEQGAPSVRLTLEDRAEDQSSAPGMTVTAGLDIRL